MKVYVTSQYLQWSWVPACPKTGLIPIVPHTQDIGVTLKEFTILEISEQEPQFRHIHKGNKLYTSTLLMNLNDKSFSCVTCTIALQWKSQLLAMSPLRRFSFASLGQGGRSGQGYTMQNFMDSFNLSLGPFHKKCPGFQSIKPNISFSTNPPNFAAFQTELQRIHCVKLRIWIF